MIPLSICDSGVRSLEIQGKEIKFSSIGVYVEAEAVPSLAAKWKEKTAEELANSVEFFRDIVTGEMNLQCRSVDNRQKKLSDVRRDEALI